MEQKVNKPFIGVACVKNIKIFFLAVVWLSVPISLTMDLCNDDGSINYQHLGNLSFNLPFAALDVSDDINSTSIPFLQNSLTNIGENSTIKQVVAGYSHLVVLLENGSVYGAGANDVGQLGLGDTVDRSTLTLMSGEGVSGCSAIAAGARHTVVLKTDGAVYATGDDEWGQLGRGLSSDDSDVGFRGSYVTTLTRMVGAGESECSAIAAGGRHTVILKNDGTVYSVGDNAQRQLSFEDLLYTSTLMRMDSESLSVYSAVAAGERHSALLRNTGAVYAAGDRSWGQFGSDCVYPPSAGLVPLGGEFMSSCTALAAGGNHIVVMKVSGKLHSTGLNCHGRPGRESNEVLGVISVKE